MYCNLQHISFDACGGFDDFLSRPCAAVLTRFLELAPEQRAHRFSRTRQREQTAILCPPPRPTISTIHCGTRLLLVRSTEKWRRQMLPSRRSTAFLPRLTLALRSRSILPQSGNAMSATMAPLRRRTSPTRPGRQSTATTSTVIRKRLFAIT